MSAKEEQIWTGDSEGDQGVVNRTKDLTENLTVHVEDKILLVAIAVPQTSLVVATIATSHVQQLALNAKRKGTLQEIALSKVRIDRVAATIGHQTTMTLVEVAVVRKETVSGDRE